MHRVSNLHITVPNRNVVLYLAVLGTAQLDRSQWVVALMNNATTDANNLVSCYALHPYLHMGVSGYDDACTTSKSMASACNVAHRTPNGAPSEETDVLVHLVQYAVLSVHKSGYGTLRSSYNPRYYNSECGLQ